MMIVWLRNNAGGALAGNTQIVARMARARPAPDASGRAHVPKASSLPYPSLHYPTLPYPTLPYPSLPCPTLSSLNSKTLNPKP